VWEDVNNFQFKSVAIATGIGVRWETLFGPFRLDWGIRVFDPTRAEGNQWITQRQLLGETFAEGVFHFGIGHAF
jgi:outer membrane protein assembly factor BamA